MKRTILWLSLFLAGYAGLGTKSGRANLLPATAADSLPLEVNCTDSTGSKCVCDSIWFAVWRGTTLIDSGRTTTPSGSTVGSTRLYIRPGRDSTYVIKTVGQTTAGRYAMSATAWGGTYAGKRLNWPFAASHDVGPLVTSTYLAAANTQSGTIDSADFAADFYTKSLRSAHTALVDSATGVGIRNGSFAANGFATDAITAGALATAAAQEIASNTADSTAQFNYDPDNLIHDPGFEGTSTLGRNWSQTAATVNIVTNSSVKSGRRCARLAGGSASEITSDSFRVTTGQRVWLGADILSGQTLNEYGLKGAATVTFNPLGGGLWYKYQQYWKATATGAYRFYALSNGGANDTLRLDNVFVKIVPDSLTPASFADADSLRDTLHVMHVETNGLNGWTPITDNDSLKIDLSTLAGGRIHTFSSDTTHVPPTDSVKAMGTAGLVFATSDRRIHHFNSDTARPDFGNIIGTLDTAELGTDTKQAFGKWISAGTAAGVSGTSITLADAPAVDSLRGAWVHILSATTGAGQTRMVASYNTSTHVATTTPSWGVTPTGTIKYVLYAGYGGLDNALLYPDAEKVIQDSTKSGVWRADFGTYDNVGGSFGDSAKGWGQTGSSSGVDSATLARELKRKIAGLALNGTDTLSVGQRLFTSNNPCATCTFGTLYTDTVYAWNTASSSTIPNVNVQVRNSSGTVVGTFQTSSAGKFTGTFDAGTYYLYPYFTSGIAWRSTDNPDTFVVTGNGQIDTIKGQTISYPAPPVGGQITVSGNIFDLVGDSIPGVTVEFSLNQNAYFSTDDTTNMVLVAKTARSRQTDVSGLWSIPLYPTTKLLGDDRRKGVYYTCKIYMPDGITTYENSGQITFSHDNCCQVFQYKNYRPWVTQ